MALTNPAVKRKLLEGYADDADSSAVHLKAAHLPRQASYVILPVNSLKETEIYAPNFRDGERVVLIRHPHGGTFEIPELTVNNRHAGAKRLLGDNPRDAVGIHSKVAEKLSGADFDGDAVLVIPNNSRKIKTAPTLAGLKDFDPRAAYPEYPGMKPMDARTKGTQMGDISNLITDMTIKGASMPELARAVRHSMVVIDAEKHNLNWKLSAQVNGIAQLKTKYQGRANAGASTLISKATSRLDVNERRQGFKIDPDTGRKIYTETGRIVTNKQGQSGPKKERSTKLAETDDAHTLSTGMLIEKLYADHSNTLKDLANKARLAIVRTKSVPYSPSARLAYAKEVASLDSQLNIAIGNRPLERQAQVVANAIVVQKRQANPEMEPAELKKIKFAALEEARNRTGADKKRIEISDREWEAIQAGAISNNKLSQILNNADLDKIKQRATPKARLLMTATKQARAATMLAAGYSRAEVADHLGVSVSTLNNSLSS
jgi:DNA-binding CsgD family transcriptional regulator